MAEYKEPSTEVADFIEWLRHQDNFSDAGTATIRYSENETGSIQQWIWGWIPMGDPGLWTFTFTRDQITPLVAPEWIVMFTNPGSSLEFRTLANPSPEKLGHLAWACGWTAGPPELWKF